MPVEPWLSGSLQEVDPLLRPVLHSFQQVREDAARWTEGLTAEQLWAQPHGVGPAGFHLRHIAGSIDRLFTYAQGRSLTEEQMAELRAAERDPGLDREALLTRLDEVLDRVSQKIRSMDPATLRDPRAVGRQQLPTTVMGLMLHMAEHAQRHVGELIVTAKLVRAS